MNNLLNEDELLPKVYDPKRWFNTFYLTAIAIAIIILLLFKFVIPSQSNVWAIFYGVLIAIIIPFSLSLAMVLTKKRDFTVYENKQINNSNTYTSNLLSGPKDF